jgi:hypothetical protein
LGRVAVLNNSGVGNMQHTVGSLYAALGKLVKEGHSLKLAVVDRSTLPDIGGMVAISGVGITRDSEDPSRVVVAIALD